MLSSSPRSRSHRFVSSSKWHAAAFLAGTLCAASVAAESLPLLRPEWPLREWSRAPALFPATNVVAEGLRAFFYEGLPYRGRATRVFAFYGAPTNATRGPAMVLVHGGGGTAFAEWVRLWNRRGYAAIAMDLCGCLPLGSYGKWQRHADGGPAGWGGFEQMDEPISDQWTYHAIAGIVRAHSLLRTFPEVDPQRIGLTGISWGGYLTCIAAGVDSRFRCAVPVYGCGFLGENSAWLGDFDRLGPERAARWLRWWDPSSYLVEAAIPMLWINGSNDFAYPMDSWQKSYRWAHGQRTLCLKVRMPHAHGGAGENPEEIHAFVNSQLKGGPRLPRIVGQGWTNRTLWVRWHSEVPVTRAELNFTRDIGLWQKRRWETMPASLEAEQWLAHATLPERTTVGYLNLLDARGLVVSSEHQEVPTPR